MVLCYAVFQACDKILKPSMKINTVVHMMIQNKRTQWTSSDSVWFAGNYAVTYFAVLKGPREHTLAFLLVFRLPAIVVF